MKKYNHKAKDTLKSIGFTNEEGAEICTKIIKLMDTISEEDRNNISVITEALEKAIKEDESLLRYFVCCYVEENV